MAGILEIELRFADGKNSPSQFEELLDAVTDELLKVGIDADYTASIRNLTVIWTIDVPDASEEPLIGALTALRTALQAVGVATTSWVPRHEVVSTRHLALT
jgi:hypothetical protein